MRQAGAVWAIALWVAVSTPAAAADSGRASDRALAPLVACRQTRDPAARAACYDAALDALQQSVAARQVVIIDREQSDQDRRASFGFSATHDVERPKPAKPEPVAKAPRKAPIEAVTEVDSTVVSAQPYGYDQWTIRIATGATWRTTESGIAIAPKPGTKIHIHRGVMNGYLLRVGTNRVVRAMRVN